MSDGEGHFFLRPGYESSSHERREGRSMPKTKWGSVIFTAYKFFDSKGFSFFAVLEDIHTEASPRLSTPCRGNAALPPAERGAAILAACRWLSETRALVFMENDAEFLLRRLPGTSSPPTTMTMRDISGGCWRRAACVPVAAPLWPPPCPGPDPDGLSPGSDRSACIRRSSPCWSTGPAGSCFN